MSRTTRRTRIERTEVPLPEREVDPYADLCYPEAVVTTASGRVVEEHYRTTVKFDNALYNGPIKDQVLAFGLLREHMGCGHEFHELDRFGHGRCRKCKGHFWRMSWVAAGLYYDALNEVDDTPEWALAQQGHYLDQRKKALSLVNESIVESGDCLVPEGCPDPVTGMPCNNCHEPELDAYEPSWLDMIPAGTPDSWIPDNPDENGMRDSDFI